MKENSPRKNADGREGLKASAQVPLKVRRASGLGVGLPVNLGRQKLEWKRFVF